MNQWFRTGWVGRYWLALIVYVSGLCVTAVWHVWPLLPRISLWDLQDTAQLVTWVYGVAVVAAWQITLFLPLGVLVSFGFGGRDCQNAVDNQTAARKLGAQSVANGGKTTVDGGEEGPAFPDPKPTTADAKGSVTIVIGAKLDEVQEDEICNQLIDRVDDPNLALAGVPTYRQGITRIEIAPVRDVASYAKRIDFARVVAVDVEQRTITVELNKPASKGAEKSGK